MMMETDVCLNNTNNNNNTAVQATEAPRSASPYIVVLVIVDKDFFLLVGYRESSTRCSPTKKQSAFHEERLIGRMA